MIPKNDYLNRKQSLQYELYNQKKIEIDNLIDKSSNKSIKR